MCKYGFLGRFCKLINLSPDFVHTKQYDTLSGVLLALPAVRHFLQSKNPYFSFATCLLSHSVVLSSLGQFNMLSIQVCQLTVF